MRVLALRSPWATNIVLVLSWPPMRAWVLVRVGMTWCPARLVDGGGSVGSRSADVVRLPEERARSVLQRAGVSAQSSSVRYLAVASILHDRE